ncbi:aldehyde dehydrogenase family protein [Flavobacterium sp. DG1-102-2]|uniref:aldehyde dehydrogenase family protein n=1 Tax=Flavobacterium sp. DG1-102-2 TaxID=3081663 RepID=UPI00294A568A|nr:aldehyde dehydrogenase family protein [Flavobacterium sp. DG1-102-2]MDV6167646.1 aldehyde dehydrogenase family protein [Flavobacterium sp. DG1-102-2]
MVLGNEHDVNLAVAAAKEAYKTFSQTTKEERIAYLQKLHDAVAKRQDELVAVMVLEYGGTYQFCKNSVNNMLSAFTTAMATLNTFEFERTVGNSKVLMQPLGVVGLITPWNSSNSFICNKLATAISAGSTVVIKPSEMSAMQTQLLLECFHEAGLPKGVFNVVNGLGTVVGNAITNHPDIAKISFTGSTVVGKSIARGAIDTLKRVTLELGGKSPNVILDDANLETAIPMAVAAAYMNSGQACIAGTRLLVPEHKLDEVNSLVKAAVEKVKVGNPADHDTAVGPMVSKKQYERVQGYIKLGLEEGAKLLIGGEGHPEGLEAGNFVKPTVFTNVKNSMRIAREEIFGPVLSIIAYKDEEDAIAIANDTDYGLQAYVNSSDDARAKRVASRIIAGRVMINALSHDPQAPFGGFKQSGIGREFGVFGLEEYVEPKTLLV